MLGDIGGSNARLALADPENLGFLHFAVLQCADFPSLDLALDSFLHEHANPLPAAVCLAAAGPLIDQQIKLTNSHWQVNGPALSKRLGGIPVRLLNDFEAIAWSIPALVATDLETIGVLPIHLATEQDFMVAVIGAGTGLGMAGLMRRDGVLQPLVGEGGNAGFAPENNLQLAVLQQLRIAQEPVSIEQLTCGNGVENVYRIVCQLHDKSYSALSAAEVFERAKAGSDAMAKQTVELFFEVLGQSAGNLALTIGARDGVYIAGGIAPRYPELLGASQFRQGFDNKGRYRSYMEQIPTQLIVHPQPGLLGAGLCARQLILQSEHCVPARAEQGE